MDCTKCEYYKTGDFETFDKQVVKNMQIFHKKCVHCNGKLPWLTESQFKEKQK